MATIQGNLINNGDGSFTASWLAITEADVGSPIKFPSKAYDVTAQTVGDFTTSGAISLYGSNDGTNYAVLNEGASTAIVMVTASKIWKVDSPPVFVQPRATAGSAVAMDVYISGRIY